MADRRPRRSVRGRRLVLGLVLGALIAGGVLASLGEPGGEVGPAAVLEVWGGALRDADRIGLRLTRVSAAEEMAVGARMAGWFEHRPRGDAASSAYVAAVGAALVPYVRRREIAYEFSVIDSRWINAFALPGGRVFVTTGLLDVLESEAELAAVLGHEMAHVDLRHCIERLQYRLQLERLRLDVLPVAVLHDLGRWLVTVGYSRYEELDADAQGLRMAIQAGYDPHAAAAVFGRLAADEAGERSPARPRTPVHEVGGALGAALGSYFQSHPPSEDRLARLERYVERNHRRLAGRVYYLGRENHARRVPRTVREFPSERRPR